MLVRLERITGVDPNVFEFDYDLTWMGFFFNADERIYGRYGGRDARSAEDNLSLLGLRHAMQAALASHRPQSKVKTAVVSPRKPVRAEQYAAARNVRRGECIHCHQIHEFRRFDLKSAGTLRREDLWVYPLPKNLGLTLDVHQGDRVKAVSAGSSADKAGLRAGDIIRTLNGKSVHSFGDAQYALHRAPAQGQLRAAWERAGVAHSGTMELKPGWRQTNWTWRPSMLDILPALSLYGDDLTVQEKKALGLPAKRLAFRQEKTVQRDALKMGVRGGDIVIGIDNKALEMDVLEFLGYVRKNYLVGDKITLNIIRNGKRIKLPGQL